MKYLRLPALSILLLLFSLTASAQKAEISISLNEAFFDAALAAVFQSGAPLEFSIARTEDVRAVPPPTRNSFSSMASCPESIKILREVNGVRTAVRFREGKIIAPLAFSGNYNPPFVGCVAFAGWAESSVD